MKTFFTFATLNGMLSGVSCVYLRVVGKPRESWSTLVVND